MRSMQGSIWDFETEGSLGTIPPKPWMFGTILQKSCNLGTVSQKHLGTVPQSANKVLFFQ